MPTEEKSDAPNRGAWPLKRRTFLGLGLSGFAGLSLPGWPGSGRKRLPRNPQAKRLRQFKL